MNGWSYVEGNPINYRDPSGYCRPLPGIDCTERFLTEDGTLIQVTARVVEGEQCSSCQNGPVYQTPTYQPLIDNGNIIGNLAVWPAAVAGNTKTFVKGGLAYEPTIVTPRYIIPIRLRPNLALDGVPSGWARGATVFSYGYPIIIGELNRREIQYRAEAGEITSEQAYKQGIANAGFSAFAAFEGGIGIPVALAGSSHPVGWGFVGGICLAYAVSVFQGTYNNWTEGQSPDEALLNARVQANKQFGLGEWFDRWGYDLLNPVLVPILTPIAEYQYLPQD
jgi:hypothetical protein